VEIVVTTLPQTRKKTMSDEKTLDEHIDDVRDEKYKQDNKSESSSDREPSGESTELPNDEIKVSSMLLFGMVGTVIGGAAAGLSSAVAFGIIAGMVGWFIPYLMSEETLEGIEESIEEKQQQQKQQRQQRQQQQIKTSEGRKAKVICQQCGWQNNNNNNYCNDCGEPINESS